MLLVIKTRPATKHLATILDQILELARSCQRQLTAWITSIEHGPIQGKRHMTANQKQVKKSARTVSETKTPAIVYWPLAIGPPLATT